MTSKIDVRICSSRQYDTFVEKHAEDHLFRFPDNSDTVIHNFLSELQSLQVAEETSVLELAQLIWHDESFVKASRGALVFQRADTSQVERRLYCYQFGSDVLDTNQHVGELHYDHSLTLVYREDYHIPEAREDSLKISLARNPNPRTRTYLDFVTDSLPDSEFSYALKGVIIPSLDSSKRFGHHLRTNYHKLVKAAGSVMELNILEKENTDQNRAFLDYWQSNLIYPKQFDFYRFLGYCSHRPYSQNEIDKILGKVPEIQEFPGLLLYRNLDEGYILLTIDKGISRFFEPVLRTLWKVNATIKTEIRELKSSIESKIELVELPPFQSQPGSLARKEEALVMARETKKQEQAGKIAPQNVYKEVDRIFQTEGKELSSFGYFKEKFLRYYPLMKERRPTGLV